LVDLNAIPSLDYIREENGEVRFGAMTRQRTIEFSPLVRQRLPLLTEATALVGHLPIRTRGTIGGSLAHADPSAEYPAVLAALDGTARRPASRPRAPVRSRCGSGARRRSSSATDSRRPPSRRRRAGRPSWSSPTPTSTPRPPTVAT